MSGQQNPKFQKRGIISPFPIALICISTYSYSKTNKD